MPEVLLPLADALERRHAPVVISEIDNPLPLVEHLLQPLGSLQITLSLLNAQSVNSGKMLQQLRPLPTVTGKQDMLDVVAISTQGLETTKPLIAGLLVILPDLVAVQAFLPTAYTAAISGPVIDGPADTVPPGTG